ncbi:MAG: hypothetical protein ACI3T9_00855 [Romboutsia timonensis]
MKKVQNWLKENKNELMFGGFILVFLLLIFSIIFNVILIAVSDDLVGVVETKEAEIQELTQERNYYYYLYDDIMQTYEETVPKQQYIDDIEYLESVILELRYQCEHIIDNEMEWEESYGKEKINDGKQ